MTDVRIVKPILVLVERLDRKGRYLLAYHDKWRTFMFPISGRRHFQDAEWGIDFEESDSEAACRAVAETTGALVNTRNICFLQEITLTEISRRLGTLTGYQLKVWRYTLTPEDEIASVLPMVWLTPEEILDKTREPISPIARELIPLLAEKQLIK